MGAESQSHPLPSPYPSTHLPHHGPDPDHLLRLVDALCASGRSAEAHRRASLLLLSPACRLDARAADAVLRRLRADTSLLTLRLLQLLPFASASAPSLPNRNRLLARLCRAGHVLLAHRPLLRMGAAPDAASYAALLDGYARVPDPRAARRLLDEMPERGVVVTSLARSFLAKALLRARDVGAAMELVDTALWPPSAAVAGGGAEEDQEVTNAAFANLVQCLCAEGFFHVVFRVAEEKGSRPRREATAVAAREKASAMDSGGSAHSSRPASSSRGGRMGTPPPTVSSSSPSIGFAASRAEDSRTGTDLP